MRETKFRAWDTKVSMMMGMRELYGMGMQVFGSPHFEHLKFMQYTGLKDKNGKETYEGDVVCFKDFTTLITAEVKWHPLGMWEYLPKDWATGYLSYHVEAKVEVIGNIYENPV